MLPPRQYFLNKVNAVSKDDLLVIWDGGVPSKADWRNGKNAYGSYLIRCSWFDGIIRVQHHGSILPGHSSTAERRTLLAALKSVVSIARRKGKKASQLKHIKIFMFGDCQSLCHQVNGIVKYKDSEVDAIKRRLEAFGSWHIEWWPRHMSVFFLGH